MIFQLPGVKSTIDKRRNKDDTWAQVFGQCFVWRGERSTIRFDFDGADQTRMRRWRWVKRWWGVTRPDIVSLFVPNERLQPRRSSGVCVGVFFYHILSLFGGTLICFASDFSLYASHLIVSAYLWNSLFGLFNDVQCSRWLAIKACIF